MSDAAAKLVWKLARRHSWGSPIPAEQLVRLSAGSEDHDEMAWVLEHTVLEFPFVARDSEGISIPNGQEAHVEVANWLRDETDLDELVLKATMSRLPPEWPDDE